jgi:ferritin-like metal-binding protein YciE
MEMDSLQDLMVHDLKDLYSAETQLLKAMPRMAKKASSPQLKKAFETHMKETEVQVERLKKICEQLGVKPTGKKCAAMEGLIEEAKEAMGEDMEPDVLDAALIGCAQKVEHYEIAGYGTARTYARILGNEQAEKLLDQTLQEEGKTDKLLTQLADQINVEAAQPD